jgi:hypothetical protein
LVTFQHNLPKFWKVTALFEKWPKTVKTCTTELGGVTVRNFLLPTKEGSHHYIALFKHCAALEGAYLT